MGDIKHHETHQEDWDMWGGTLSAIKHGWKLPQFPARLDCGQKSAANSGVL